MEEKQINKFKKIKIYCDVMAKYICAFYYDKEHMHNIMHHCEFVLILLMSILIFIFSIFIFQTFFDIKLLLHHYKYITELKGENMPEDYKCYINNTYYDEHDKYCFVIKNHICLNTTTLIIFILYTYFTFKFMSSQDNDKKSRFMHHVLLILFNYAILCIYLLKFETTFNIYQNVFLLFLTINCYITTFYTCKKYQMQITEECKKIENYEIEIMTKQDE